MKKLIAGIAKFRAERLPAERERFQRLADGQSPDALFITCSDSRIVPNWLVSTDPGDLFVVRNVGNMVPIAGHDGRSMGDHSEASAIEYALGVLGVSDIIVCGHSGCGAMGALMADKPLPDTPNLDAWLSSAGSARSRWLMEGPLDSALSPVDQLSQLNVLQQAAHVSTYPIARKRMADGKLRVHSWWFDIKTASCFAYERQQGKFVLIDDKEAQELSARLD